MGRAILLVVLALFVISIPVFAEEPAEQKGIDIEKKKEDVVSGIDRRIGVLQELKKCITDAATKEDLKKCRESFKEERRGIWGEMRRK